MKKIAFEKKSRDKLLEGCKIMYESVGVTYSPVGRNVAIGRQWGTPIVIHDGVSVAKEVEVEDELVQLGIDLIKEAAQNQVSSTGDGTSATIILAYNIVKKGMDLIDGGMNAMTLRKQILKALPILVKEIKSISQEVKTKEQIKHVALVSSDDEEIATAVMESISKVGSSGLITVELGKRQKIETEYTEGMEIERGWGSFPHFVTNPEKMEAVVEDASVLVLGRKVTLLDEIVPLLEIIIGTGSKNIVIVGEVSGDAMSTLLVNKMKGNINALVISPPGYADSRASSLEDIALITGATVVTDEIGLPKEQLRQAFDKAWIGSTKKVIATKGTTNVIRYEPSDFKKDAAKKAITDRNERIKAKIKQLQDEKDKTDSTYDKEHILERLAKLTTGIAVIKVGSKSEIETREKLERVKDAVPAAQAAVEEGIVPGGGVAFLQAIKAFESKQLSEGERLLIEVLREPIKKILTNAGEDAKDQDKIMAEIMQKGGNFGYNVLAEKVEDLIKAGVIDPTKVIRLALENAVSVATSILTTDCSIALARPKEQQSNMQLA